MLNRVLYNIYCMNGPISCYKSYRLCMSTVLSMSERLLDNTSYYLLYSYIYILLHYYLCMSSYLHYRRQYKIRRRK